MCSCRLCNFQHFFDMAFAYTCKKLHSHMYCLTFLSAVQYDSCNRPRPHYAERIWKRKFHFETYQMFSVHTASEKFENGNLTLKRIKCFQCTLRQRNLKTEISLWNTSNVFSPHCVREIWNGNLTLKPIKCFQCTLRQRNLKTEISLWNTSNVFSAHCVREIWKRESHSETHQMFSMHTASEEFENGNLTLKPIKCFQCTLCQRNLKTEISLWNPSNVFSAHCVKGIWKKNNQRSFWICVWRKLLQRNDVIIATSSLLKSSVFNIFVVHTKKN